MKEMVEILAAPEATPTTSKQGLRGEYYRGIDLMGAPIHVQVDEQINFPKREDFSIQEEQFSVRWTGKLRAPESGVYTFQTHQDDGARLWINKVGVINHWWGGDPKDGIGKIALEAGRDYEIILDYFQYGGEAAMQLYWQYGQTKLHIVPSNALMPQEGTFNLLGGGLKGEYFNCGKYQNDVNKVPPRDFAFAGKPVLTRLDSSINFHWDEGENILPGRDVNNMDQVVNQKFFAVRWSGRLRAPETGTYTFRAVSEDGVRLWLKTDGTPIKDSDTPLIDNWTWGGTPDEVMRTVQLTKGQWYPIRLEYFQLWGYGWVYLLWKIPNYTPSQPNNLAEIIPPECLSSEV